MDAWRQGRKVPQNVYEGDKPIAQFHDAETAARVVAAVNVAHTADASADALHELWKLIEDGALVRNTAYDNEAGYALKAMALVMALKHADAALRAVGRIP